MTKYKCPVCEKEWSVEAPFDLEVHTCPLCLCKAVNLAYRVLEWAKDYCPEESVKDKNIDYAIERCEQVLDF